MDQEKQADNLNENNTKIALLENNVDSLKIVCGKLEVTLDATHQLQEDISTILKMQEMKLGQLDKELIGIANNHTNSNIEKHKRLDDLSLKLKIQKEAGENVLVEVDETIDAKLDDIRLDLKDVTKRMSRMERVVYVVIGGITVISYLVSNFDKIASILK